MLILSVEIAEKYFGCKWKVRIREFQDEIQRNLIKLVENDLQQVEISEKHENHPPHCFPAFISVGDACETP